MNKIRSFVKTILYAKNGLAVVLEVFILGRTATAKIGSQFSMQVNKKNWPEFGNYINFFRYFPDGKIEGSVATIKYAGKELKFDCAGVGPWTLAEVFGWESYAPFIKDINFSGRKVVDIGAYNGDTAIYFITNGAAKVVTVEPVGWLFDLAKRNISLNKIDDVCEVLCAGVGSKALPDISEDPTFEVVFGGYEAFKGAFKPQTPVITLESIVENNSVNDGVLKIDCEGWEYDIFNSASDELLRRFEFIVAEYHYGPEELIKRLSGAGFEVSAGAPHHIYVSERKGKYADMMVGMLLAKRADRQA